MSITKLITAIKGGSGSGNFGHSGRPGVVGGSGGGGGLVSLITTPEREMLIKHAENLKKVDGIEKFEIVGSFVSDKPVPGDLDLIAKIKPGYDPFDVEKQFWNANTKNVNVNVFFLADAVNELTGTNTYKWMINNTKNRYGKEPIEF